MRTKGWRSAARTDTRCTPPFTNSTAPVALSAITLRGRSSVRANSQPDPSSASKISVSRGRFLRIGVSLLTGCGKAGRSLFAAHSLPCRDETLAQSCPTRQRLFPWSLGRGS